jgi:hypothetical protein
MTVKKPSAGLRAQGKALWRSLTADYELGDHELSLLLQAARTVDLLDDLEAEIRSGGALVDSPQGRKANPAAVEARQQRLALARLLAALRIPLDDSHGADRTQTRSIRGVYKVGA